MPLKNQHGRRGLAFVVAAVASAAPAARAADTVVNWAAPTDGAYTTAGNWSPAVVPNGSGYAANVSAAGSAYTVTIDASAAVDGLTVNSADATVVQADGTYTFHTLNLSAGVYDLSAENSATTNVLAGGTINLLGGTLQLDEGTLSGVTVAGGDLDATDAILYVQNGLSLSGHTLQLGTGEINLVLSGPSQTLDHLTIAGSERGEGSSVYLLGAASGTQPVYTFGAAATLTGPLTFFGPASMVNSGTITGGGGDFTTIEPAAFTNNGTVKTNGGELYITSAHWTNAAGATISVAGDGDLYLDGAWSNAGTITGTYGTINLGGTFTTAGLGTITPNAARVNVTGTLDNTAATLTLNAATGSWTLDDGNNFAADAGGTITGGTVAQTQGSTLGVVNGTLSGVTLSGPGATVGSYGTLHVTGGLTGSGNTLTVGYAAAVYLDGPAQTLAGLTLSGQGGTAQFAAVNQAATAPFADDLTLTATGAGTSVLAAANTYTGGTTITAGAVVRADNAVSALGSGTTAVGAGGVLAGVGTTGGPVTVGSGSATGLLGLITAGTGATANDSVGTLTTGAETWTVGGGLVVKVNAGAVTGTAAAPAAGDPAADRLVLSGLTVTASSTSPFNVSVAGLGTSPTTLAAGSQLILATVQNGTKGSITSILADLRLTTTDLSAAGGTPTLAEVDVGSDVDLALVVSAPEPATLALLAAAAAPLLLARRRAVPIATEEDR